MKPVNIPAALPMSRIPADSWESIDLNKNTDWVGEILTELNEKATYRTEEMYFSSAHLDIDLKIKKKYRASMGEVALVKCKLNTTYYTQCVVTSNEMKDSLELEFQAAFIHGNYEKAPEYEEVTEIFEENEVYELYFHNNGNVNLKESIHEQIYLNYNQYPKLDAAPDEDPNLDNLQ